MNNVQERRLPVGRSSDDHASGWLGRLHKPSAWLGLIVLLGLVLRLYHVTWPPVDFLAWRETQTLMLARNYYRQGMNLFSPSVDWRTTRELLPRGSVGGTELPVVPYLTAMLYHVFGLRYWVGRMIPITFSLVGAAYFFSLVQRFYGLACAVFSATLLTVSPYYLYCGRLQMPESFAFAMSFATLYCYDKWLAQERSSYWPALAYCVLAMLGKPAMVIIAAPMLFLTVLRFKTSFVRQPRLYLFAAAVALPVAAWTVHSRAVTARTGLSFMQPDLLNHALLLTVQFYRSIATVVWRDALTPVVALLALIGLALRCRSPREWFAHSWLFGSILLWFLMPGGCSVNGYYHLIMVPPAAVLAGRALSSGLAHRRLWIPVGLVWALAMGSSLQVAARAYHPVNRYAHDCGVWLNRNTPKDALVLTATANPATLYFADRVGWICWYQDYGTPIHFDHELVNAVGALGASVLAIPDPRFDDPDPPTYRHIRNDLYATYRCHRDNGFTVFFLTEPAPPH